MFCYLMFHNFFYVFSVIFNFNGCKLNKCIIISELPILKWHIWCTVEVLTFNVSLRLLQVETEDNILRDGTLIDLCGATLLWRSAVGLLASPVSSPVLLSLETKQNKPLFLLGCKISCFMIFVECFLVGLNCFAITLCTHFSILFLYYFTHLVGGREGGREESSFITQFLFPSQTAQDDYTSH